MLGGFLNSGLGRAIAMGTGFGISNDLINKTFQTDTEWRVRIRHSVSA